MYENLERVVAVSLAGGVHWKDQREAKPLIFNTQPLIICGCEERDGEIHTLIPLYNLRQWNQVQQLLHKFVVIVGDSVQRAVYEDLVLPLQKDCLPSSSQLKTKGELSFEHHTLLEGCRQEGLHCCTRYREMRPFCVGHHLVLVYFLAHPLRLHISLHVVTPDPVLQMWCGVSKARVFAWLGLGGTQHSSHGKRSSQAAIGSLGCFRCLSSCRSPLVSDNIWHPHPTVSTEHNLKTVCSTGKNMDFVVK
ncbi:hypothetical protein MG293_004672 [Ovis ammon polii]|uniref:Uncharacterized protein n=1 Tax=Ovis ammon polii TaxID=230172 RepID=A0AAD4YF92_OVIAM|nr:hypothetical protein MG293_004672 [Ovis ammon polii]